MIAFVGSVFSPYYALARARGPAVAENHVAINAILYTPRGRLWTMTERGTGALRRDADRIDIGPSRLFWQEGRLIVEIAEWTVPVPRRLSGRIEIDPGPILSDEWALDPAGRHRWRPWAPCARVALRFESPTLAWQGRAYCDTNHGSEPLERGFSRWDWARREIEGGTRIVYDPEPRAGKGRPIGLDCLADGTWSLHDPGPRRALPATGWRVARFVRSTAEPHLIRTLEDTPFYARSLVATGHSAIDAPAIHESVDLDRFASGWVRMLLPFRMPRRR